MVSFFASWGIGNLCFGLAHPSGLPQHGQWVLDPIASKDGGTCHLATFGGSQVSYPFFRLSLLSWSQRLQRLKMMDQMGLWPDPSKLLCSYGIFLVRHYPSHVQCSTAKDHLPSGSCLTTTQRKPSLAQLVLYKLLLLFTIDPLWLTIHLLFLFLHEPLFFCSHPSHLSRLSHPCPHLTHGNIIYLSGYV